MPIPYSVKLLKEFAGTAVRSFSLVRVTLESRGMEPRLSINQTCLVLSWRFRRLAAISRAAAFALAGVLALAAVVPALATALALTRVHAFAGVLVRVGFLFAHFERDTSLRAGLDGVRGNGKRTAHQTGNRCAGNHCF